ncbi:MAG: hypothetical protein ACI9YE_003806 [Psychroserpens sp.]|jgi:hypothetical protein
MAQQIKPSVTNPSIAVVYKTIERGELTLQPDFQRKFVWTHEHQEQFIETILKGFPFPEVYICDGEINVAKMLTIKNVIDGQQRLTTIKNYIDDKFKQPLVLVAPYTLLSEAQKKSFLSYQVVMRDLGEIDEETTREIFRRINLTKFKLDNIEIQNAIYDGEFIQAAKFILDNIELSKFGVFRESEFSRMADLHFMLLVMGTIENQGYFAQDKMVEKLVALNNDKYSAKDHIISLLIKAFAIISDLNIPADSMWFRKSNFFTLVCEVAKNIDNLPEDFFVKLCTLEESVMDAKRNLESPYAKYYSSMYQATHSRSARVIRSEYLLAELKK